MRKDYYNLIKEYGLSDILSEIQNISYTKKQIILSSLLETYSPQTLNMALNDYKIKYIDLNRVDVFRLKNTLKYFCKKFEKN